jgi:hypothetical protein
MNAAIAAPRLETSVDFERHFIPEEFTPLFYTQSYMELTEEQQLRYNQLHAIYFNEQIMFFEATLGQSVLEGLLRQAWPERVAEALRRLRDEERQHTVMFRRLNQLCAPHLYATGDFHFVQAPRPLMALGRWAARHPRLFPMLLWLMLLQEERSLYYSREFVRRQAILELHFVEAQRLHMADEADHVCLDEELIDALWAPAPPRLRRINARLFSWMLGEFFNTPRRAQLRVVDELVREFPALGPRRQEIRRQMLALSHDTQYQTTLYSRDIVPTTFARFDEWPEFRSLGISSYHPPVPARLKEAR